MLTTDDRQPTADYRQLIKMSWFELIADRRIRDAQDEGKFNDLEGKGKPLNLEIDSRVPPEQRIANRLMKDANLLPDWIQVDKEVRIRAERVREKEAAYANRRAADMEPGRTIGEAKLDGRRDEFLIYMAKELRDLNRTTDRLNLLAPASRQRFRVNLAERMAELEDRYPRIQPDRREVSPWADIIREERPATRLSNRMPVRRKRSSIG